MRVWIRIEEGEHGDWMVVDNMIMSFPTAAEDAKWIAKHFPGKWILSDEEVPLESNEEFD